MAFKREGDVQEWLHNLKVISFSKTVVLIILIAEKQAFPGSEKVHQGPTTRGWGDIVTIVAYSCSSVSDCT